MADNLITHKSNKPKALMIKRYKQEESIKQLETKLPSFLRDYYIFLRSSVSPATRLAYLRDILFFFEYLVREQLVPSCDQVINLSINELTTIKARTVNEFIGNYCRGYSIESGGKITIYENNNFSLSRKKSSLASMFRFLHRNEQLPNDITIGFNPIKVPKKLPDSIKRLYESEINSLLQVVREGTGLTDRELVYWEKTKYRDEAIVLLFLTYGLRLKEVAELELGSFNFRRNEFVIYRKRDKESIMPINHTIERSIKNYLRFERDSHSKLDSLFLSLQGTRLSERAIRNTIKKYTAITLDTERSHGFSPHKLRATTASTLIDRGFSIYDVQNLLDHENIMTTQLYASHRKHARENIVRNFELDDS